RRLDRAVQPGLVDLFGRFAVSLAGLAHCGSPCSEFVVVRADASPATGFVRRACTEGSQRPSPTARSRDLLDCRLVDPQATRLSSGRSASYSTVVWSIRKLLDCR